LAELAELRSQLKSVKQQSRHSEEVLQVVLGQHQHQTQVERLADEITRLVSDSTATALKSNCNKRKSPGNQQDSGETTNNNNSVENDAEQNQRNRSCSCRRQFSRRLITQRQQRLSATKQPAATSRI
jgi:hypothetical protein